VIDNLCDDGRRDNPTITCFYFDFAARKEQPPVSMLGSLLKQLVFRLGEMPEEVSRAYKTERMQLGGGGIVSTIFKNAAEYLCQKARVYVHRWSKQLRGGTLG